jgi:hypothetical protein
MTSVLSGQESAIEVVIRASRRWMWACLVACLVVLPLLELAGCAEFPITTITTSQLPNARPGLPYAAPLNAVGGRLPYHWTLASGALPTGVHLNTSTGVLAGVPKQLGNFKFTVQVADTSPSKTETDARSLALAVGLTPLQITTSVLPTVQTGSEFQTSFTVTGGVPPYTWSVASGQLPSGFTLASGTGVLSGTASQAGQSNFSVQVSDSASPAPQAVMKVLTLTVAAAVVPSITTQPTSQTVPLGQSANFSVAASGISPLSYQWRKNGTAISGATSPVYTTAATTASDNSSQFTVVVSNSAGNATSNPATLAVKAAGQLTASTPNLTYGNVPVGSSSILPVTLTNTGSSSVSISSVSLSGAGVSISGVSSGLILAAGNSAALNVTFGPSASGNLNGSVTITSTATNPTVMISLLGRAVQPVSHSVTLFWTPSSASVAGYNIYRSSVSGGPYTRLNSSLGASMTYLDSTVLASQTYYYVATSVDSTNDESVYSNEVSFTIPTP